MWASVSSPLSKWYFEWQYLFGSLSCWITIFIVINCTSVINCVNFYNTLWLVHRDGIILGIYDTYLVEVITLEGVGPIDYYLPLTQVLKIESTNNWPAWQRLYEKKATDFHILGAYRYFPIWAEARFLLPCPALWGHSVFNFSCFWIFS